MYTDILGFKIFNRSKEDLLLEIELREKTNIISGNPEVLFNGLENHELMKNFQEKYSVIIPDGVGTVLASKIVRKPVKEKIAGIEVMKDVLKSCEKEGRGVYFLGAKEETLESFKVKITEMFPRLKVLGSHNGYFELDDCESIIKEIKDKNPWGIFVAMGCPRQEKFIEKYINDLPCKFYMGVGGSFDVFAGNIKRAPKWMISIGLEWLYRVTKEPWRIKRLGTIPKFLWRVIRNR